jgi:hypothetical protein
MWHVHFLDENQNERRSDDLRSKAHALERACSMWRGARNTVRYITGPTDADRIEFDRIVEWCTQHSL